MVLATLVFYQSDELDIVKSSVKNLFTISLNITGINIV